MAVFDNCSVLLDLKNLPLKERRSLKLSVTDNGGSLCFVVTKQCSFVVVSDILHLSSNRLRSICRFQTPVVGFDYVHSCLQRGILLPVDDYKINLSSLDASSHILPLSSTKQSPFKDEVSRAVVKPSKDETSPSDKSGSTLGKSRIYTEQDENLPVYPDDFNVAKYSIFYKDDSRSWCVLELQSAKGKKRQQYRVIHYWKDQTLPSDMVMFPSTSEQAVEVFQTLTDTLLASGLQPWTDIPPQDQNFGSKALQQLLLEEKLNAGVLSQDVAVFVELLWTEALGCLDNLLKVPVNEISLNDVSRAEGLLLEAQRKLKEPNVPAACSLLSQVHTLLPCKYFGLGCSPLVIAEKLDLCQLVRDILNVSEMTLRSPTPSCIGKFRALRCNIETVETGCDEYRTVSSLLKDSAVQIHQVLRVSRAVELQTFKGKLGNIKSLLHSSSASNFVGILSRGLLLPCFGVENWGIKRTDAGNLGTGIYFSDSMRTSLKYSKPGVTDGSRLLLVCEVALGRCLKLHQRDPTLTQAPEGHNSVHGVRRTATTHSEFEGDEYVVYSPDQVKLKYVVQFSIDGEQLKAFAPAVDTSAESCLPPAGSAILPDDDGIGSIKNPLDDVTAGLMDSSGQQLPLLAVHVKCKLMDLLSHVVIFQKYINLSNVPIEAKYVFPLDDYAAVCGFEAFINGKHVVGQVKEKEQARKQYKEAIEKGHGAYLMDQDAPDIFTISVGNLPPGASVLIKVTFVSELINKDGSVLFTLPGSVAPWQASAALNQTTQVTVDKVCVTDDAANTREFSLDMCIEMPYEISSLRCLTHEVKMKRTECKAVVSVLPGQVMAPEGFQLSVTLSEVHLPRMWVEEHPDKDSQACMLVFYPNFDIKPTSGSDEVVILLDTSESMWGEPLLWAQRIAQHVIRSLKSDLKINIILFGTDHTQAFLIPQPLEKARRNAENFIQSITPVGGSTELWRPLQALALLPPSHGVHNLLLLSDGHIQNVSVTMQLLRDNTEHSRFFTCGISSTANRHMLRALAQAGCGAYEFFDAKSKHKWAEKVECQVRRMASPGCSSVSVKWQQFNPLAPPPVQAPKQLHALFNDCHTLIYGFVPHCTQATLLGNLSGQELRAMVSTSELQKTRGTFLHKLTARALIRDYEDGILDSNQTEHEGKKNQLKSFIIDLSKEFSILSQFTSFVAIEEREPVQAQEEFTDIPKLLAEEDVDILPYINWTSLQTFIEEEEDVDHTYFYLSKDSPSLSLSPTFPELSRERGTAYLSKSDIKRPPILKRNVALLSTMDANRLQHCTASALHFKIIDAPPPRPITKESNEHKSRPPPESPVVPPPPSTFVLRPVVALPPPPPPPPSGLSFVPPPSLFHQPLFFPYSSPRRNITFDDFSPSPPQQSDIKSCKILQGASSGFGLKGNTFSTYSHVRDALPPAAEDPNVSKPLILCSSSLPPKKQSLHRPYILAATSESKFKEVLPPVVPSMEAKGMDELESDDMDIISVESSGQSPRRARRSVKVSANEGPTQLLGRICDSFTEGASIVDPYGGLAPAQPLTQVSLDYSREDRDALPTRRSVKIKSRICKALMRKTEFQHNISTQSTEYTSAVDFSFECQATNKAALDEVLQEDNFENRPLKFHLLMPRIQAAPQLSQTMFGSGKSSGTASVKWPKIFQMQISDGYWELSAELGTFVNIDLDVFTAFLESKGIRSLGVKACADILRLLATLLVLQLMRLEKLPEGALLRTLFCLEDSSIRPMHWQDVKKAVDWVCLADRQYPCICSRLEFGFTWETATRQLLGYDGPPTFSPLAGLKLRKNMSAALPPVLVH